jgi:hypothetical protein
MPKRRTETEISWDVKAIEDGEGRLVAIQLTRRQTVYPITAVGHRQWREGEATGTEMGTFAVGELPDAIRELVSWLAYFASAEADANKDHS